MPLLEVFSCNSSHNVDELIDRHHLVGPDINRSSKFRARQPHCALEALLDVKKRSGLLSVTPDLDLTSLWCHSDLPANRRRRLLLAVVPTPLRTENVVIPGNPHFHAVVASIG